MRHLGVIFTYFEKLLNYYGVSSIQLTLNSYHHMAALLVAYKQSGFPEPSTEEFACIYSLKENSGDHGSIILANGIVMMLRHYEILRAI